MSGDVELPGGSREFLEINGNVSLTGNAVIKVKGAFTGSITCVLFDAEPADAI